MLPCNRSVIEQTHSSNGVIQQLASPQQSEALTNESNQTKVIIIYHSVLSKMPPPLPSSVFTLLVYFGYELTLTEGQFVRGNSVSVSCDAFINVFLTCF